MFGGCLYDSSMIFPYTVFLDSRMLIYTLELFTDPHQICVSIPRPTHTITFSIFYVPHACVTEDLAAMGMSPKIVGSRNDILRLWDAVEMITRDPETNSHPFSHLKIGKSAHAPKGNSSSKHQVAGLP